MRTIKAHGIIESGRLKIFRRERFAETVKCFEDCNVEIEVRRLFPRRSSKIEHADGTATYGQNGYYHTVIVQSFIDGAWEQNREMYDHDRAHEQLKANCNYSDVVDEKTGSIRRVILSTANLTTVQFEEYLDRCRAFIQEWFGIDCPLPNEQAEIIFK